MKVNNAIKKELGRMSGTSTGHFLLAIIASLLVSGIALMSSPLNLRTLPPSKTVTALAVPFAALFFFYSLIQKPGHSVLRFAKYVYYIGTPFLLILLTRFIFDPSKAELFNNSFFSRFLPVWAAVWWPGVVLLYVLMRAAGYALRKGSAERSFAARAAYALAVMFTPQEIISKQKRPGKGKWFQAAVCMLMIALAVFLFTVTVFLYVVYTNMDFEAILFTIRFAAGGLALEDLLQGFTLTVFFALITGYICFYLLRCFLNDEIVVEDSSSSGKYTLVLNSRKRMLCITLSAVMLAGCTALFSAQTHFTHYLSMKHGRSALYESYYVEPDSKTVVFPEEKRNLIYIFLESIENTFASREAGGCQERNYISELTELTKDENSVSFSNTQLLGGASVFVPSITYTQGSTVAQTSGIAMNVQLSQLYSSPEYPSMIRLEDILHDNGYEQLYIEGSKGEFSLYDKYVGRYENSYVFDRKTAAERGYTDENADYMWKWGIEDKKLIEITKELITDISRKDKPFFVTMYTMDTHTFESGHRCSACDESIANDYLAAVDCSSRQIYEFVQWIKAQPFYKNTTVILVGDHLGNKKTMKIGIDEDFVRTTYNCIINPAKKPVNTKDRLFSSLDMFPTTLSAIGAEIKGDRLGLGTDLFSQTKTLCEELGEEEYMKQLEQTSEFYKREFFGK